MACAIDWKQTVAMHTKSAGTAASSRGNVCNVDRAGSRCLIECQTAWGVRKEEAFRVTPSHPERFGGEVDKCGPTPFHLDNNGCRTWCAN
jgi:hypothetical protein